MTDSNWAITETGYKRDSPDVNNLMNIIPGNRITMKGVDFPVLGIDNLGNSIRMIPDKEYLFPGDFVVEVPEHKLVNGDRHGNSR